MSLSPSMPCALCPSPTSPHPWQLQIRFLSFAECPVSGRSLSVRFPDSVPRLRWHQVAARSGVRAGCQCGRRAASASVRPLTEGPLACRQPRAAGDEAAMDPRSGFCLTCLCCPQAVRGVGFLGLLLPSSLGRFVLCHADVCGGTLQCGFDLHLPRDGRSDRVMKSSFAIRVFSLLKCLFVSLACVFIELFVLSVDPERSLCLLNTSLLGDVICR